MGIGFVLIVYAFGGAVAATIGCLVLRRVVAGFVLGAGRSRTLLIRAVTAFPFACLFWAGGVFVFSAAVNVLLLHRDVGIGDGFDCPLPNGYALSFIDRTDVGSVYYPNGRPVWSEVRENGVNDVTAMQLAGPYILASVDSHKREHFEEEHISEPDSWFLLNTKTGERTDFKTLAGLKESARRSNIALSLVPVGNLYSKYRFTWFDAFAGALLVVPPLIALVLLTRWTLRLRRTLETG
jgi:hypothetical protein